MATQHLKLLMSSGQLLIPTSKAHFSAEAREVISRNKIQLSFRIKITYSFSFQWPTLLSAMSHCIDHYIGGPIKKQNLNRKEVVEEIWVIRKETNEEKKGVSTGC